MIEFEGKLSEMGGGITHTIVGEYEWIDRLTPEPRVKGRIYARTLRRNEPEGELRFRRQADLFLPDSRECPYMIFEQRQFLGRAARLRIPGVGLSPVRLRSPGVYDDVSFEAWTPPVPDATAKEVAESLWTPIYDALLGIGEDDLAGMARAACVMIEGFRPDKRKNRTSRPDDPRRRT